MRDEWEMEKERKAKGENRTGFIDKRRIDYFLANQSSMSDWSVRTSNESLTFKN